jgi:hypothetical protein
VNLSNFEDKPIIGTKRYEPFQRMCSMAGAFAVYEAKQAGLPITSAKNGKIVKEYPNGTVEVLGDAAPWVPVKKRIYKLPKA